MYKSGNEVEVGDTIIGFITGQVKTLRPYTGSLLELLGEGSQIATFHGTTSEMTLPTQQSFVVQR